MLWILPDDNPGDDIVTYILSRRGVPTEQMPSFLQPTRDQIYDSHLLHDSQKAAQAILETVKAGKKIVVHGDFDVDGVCATAIMWDFLYRELKADVLPYIPNRFDEGYGLSPSSLDAIIEMGAELVITVDCGVKNVAEVAEYREKGLQFVITDHHSLPTADEGLEQIIQQAAAIVHPKHPLGNYPFPEICGAVVAWKTCQTIAAEAGLDVDMDKYLEFAALATVCDIMPLVDENRAIVRLGLEKMRQTSSPGLLALLQQSGIQPASVEPYHFGFVIGPRLNAAGRLESAMNALRLLTTQDPAQASQIAAELNSLNLSRQDLTKSLVEEAETEIAKLPADQKVFFVHGSDWPEGIVGLVAGRLADKYNRPVLIASDNGEVIKGSARSQGNLHIANLFKDLDHLLERHGGHSGAAGFTLLKQNLSEFSEQVVLLVGKQLEDANLEKVLEIDVVLPEEEANLKLLDQIVSLQPFGQGNSEPVVALLGIEVKDIFRMGAEKQHLKLKLGKSGLEAVAFRADPEWFRIQAGDIIDIAGNLSINEWNGTKRIQMVVRDIRT